MRRHTKKSGCFCGLSGGSDLAGLFCCADCQATTAFSTLLVAVTRCLRRSPLRKEGIAVTHSLRVQCTVAQKAWGQGWFAAVAAGTCGCLLTSQWTRKHRGECQYPLFPFVPSRSSALGSATYIHVSLPFSVRITGKLLINIPVTLPFNSLIKSS